MESLFVIEDLPILIFKNETLKEEYKNFKIYYDEISKKTIERETKEYHVADLISVPSSLCL